MEPSPQVDTLILRHLLAHWDALQCDSSLVWQMLELDAEQLLPRWLNSEPLCDVLATMGTHHHPSVMVSSAMYLARQHLPLGSCLQQADCLAQGLTQAAALPHLLVPGLALTWQTDGDCLHIQPAEEAPETVQLMCLAWIAEACRRALGSGESIQLLRPPQWHQVLMPLQLSQRDGSFFRIQISSGVLQQTLPNSNAANYSACIRTFRREYGKLREHIAFYQRLQQTIADQLHLRPVNQEQLAQQLNINVRNLQRRLQALGTNYQTLLDQARRQLALRLMKDPSLTLYEVSFRVGYTEPSAFYKAFRRWTGMTPGDYRQRFDVSYI
jgi:AraC-like DNA-binding protein